MGMFRKLGGGKNFIVILWVMRLLAVLLAGYGAFCFWQADIFSYLLLKVEFAFIDYDKNAALALFQHMAMMALWISVAYYISKGIEKLSAISQKWKEKSNDER